MPQFVREAEEKAVVLRIATLLHALTSRLNGPTIAGVAPVLNEIAMDSPEVSVVEGSEFVALLSETLAAVVARRDPDHLRSILFEVHPQLIPILISFLQAPQTVAPGDVFADFFKSIINCLTDIVCAACEDKKAAADSDKNDDSWVYVSNLTSQIFCTMDTVPLCVSLLTPMLPEDVQQSAAELLFALLVRVEEARYLLAETQSFQVLYSALQEQQNPNLRAFVAACIREVSNTHAARFVQDPHVMETLLRLVAMDTSTDVRALAAETLETIFQCEPHAFRTFPRLRELAGVLVDRLEVEDSREGLTAEMKLLETLLTLEAKCGNENITTSTAMNASGEPTFAEHLLAGYADRHLVNHIQPDTRIGSLAAHCLRLLLQVAPFHRFAAFGVVQNFPTLSRLLKICVQLATDPTHRDITTQITRAETAVIIALCLAQDPRCRQLLESQLLEHPHYMAQLRSAVLSNLNAAALDYYSDVSIVDATGEDLSDIDGVDWEANHTRPTKVSIQRVLQLQEERWSRASSDDSLVRSRRSAQAAQQRNGGEVPVAAAPTDLVRRQKLVFILLTYAAHVTLETAVTAQPRPSAAYQPSQSPVTVEVSPASGVADVASSAVLNAPLPTRSSMLREWVAHPQKAAAVQRAVERNLNSTPSTPTLGAAPHTSRGAGAQPVSPAAHLPYYNAAYQPQMAASAPRQLRDDARRFTKFDYALKLARQFAQYFQGNTSTAQSRVSVFQTSGDGFAKRQVGISGDMVGGASTASATPPPSASSGSVRGWGVQHLKEADLFYFSLSVVDVSIGALEQVRSRAIRHLSAIKKSFVITPQAAKARRWFLFDMATHIMPGIIHTLSQLVELCVLHGEEPVKFPMILFRTQELQETQGPFDHHQNPTTSPEAADLHAGNLLEVLDQVRFYFAKVQRESGGGMGVAQSTPAAGSPKRSTYLEDLERKIACLSAQKFDGRPAAAHDTHGGGVTGDRSTLAHSAASPHVKLPPSFHYDSDEDDL